MEPECEICGKPFTEDMPRALTMDDPDDEDYHQKCLDDAHRFFGP